MAPLRLLRLTYGLIPEMFELAWFYNLQSLPLAMVETLSLD